MALRSAPRTRSTGADSPGFVRVSGLFGFSWDVGLPGRGQATRHQPSVNLRALGIPSGGPWDRGTLCRDARRPAEPCCHAPGASEGGGWRPAFDVAGSVA